MKLRMLLTMLTLTLSFNTLALDDRVSKNLTQLENVLSYFGCTKDSQVIQCKMIKRHLKRDTKKCWINPSKINDLLEVFTINNRTVDNPVKVKGSTKYLGFVPGRYSYDVYVQDNKINVDTSIFFFNWKKFKPQSLDQLSFKMLQAARRWDKYNPYSLEINFDLKRKNKRKESHIKFVHLQEKATRGPYFINWSTGWRYTTVSHEMGHMLGLDDEYQNNPFGGNSSNCDPESIMCRSRTGIPQEYQYYMILRRAICQL
jgi:hypothetical protein